MLLPYATPGPSSDTIATMASVATNTANTIQRRRDIITFLRNLTPTPPFRNIGRIDVTGRATVQRIQRQSQPAGQRAFAPDFRDPYRMRVGAVDRLTARAE